MEMHERIKNVRKKNDMSQNEFAERLGVTRSVISNIELNRLAKPEQKASLIKLISKEFNVSEEWLLNGTGEANIEPDTFSLDAYAKERGATEFQLELIKAILEIPADLRESLVSHFKNSLISNSGDDETVATKEEIAIKNDDITSVSNKTVEELEAEYIKSRSKIASKQAATVSNITDEKRKAQ